MFFWDRMRLLKILGLIVSILGGLCVLCFLNDVGFSLSDDVFRCIENGWLVLIFCFCVLWFSFWYVFG